MHTPQELEHKFWKALESDRTVMLGLDGVDASHTRPMTAQFEEERGPVWFFTSNDNALARHISGEHASAEHVPDDHVAILAFASKGHDLFCSARGTIAIDNDPEMIDRLWNPFVAAWYEGGKTDPKLVLLRLHLETAEIWLNESSLLAGIKMILGVDPKKHYQDKVAKVDLG